MEVEVGNGKAIRLLVGDITLVHVDAIVNAANSQLRGGGGVDGAIHRAGGPAIMSELQQVRRMLGQCLAGSAVVTGAGALPARWVFHAVGPIYHDGASGEPEQLVSCYRTCLRLAEEKAVRTISFPAISTGAYGYPIQEAATLALETTLSHLRKPETSILEIIFVLFDRGIYQIHRNILLERTGAS